MEDLRLDRPAPQAADPEQQLEEGGRNWEIEKLGDREIGNGHALPNFPISQFTPSLSPVRPCGLVLQSGLHTPETWRSPSKEHGNRSALARHRRFVHALAPLALTPPERCAIGAFRARAKEPRLAVHPWRESHIILARTGN
jgi:hypothetical protein